MAPVKDFASISKDLLDAFARELNYPAVILPGTFNITPPSKPEPHYMINVSPVGVKVEHILRTTSLALPFRLAQKISKIRFGPDGVTDPMFEVVYMGGKVITFSNIDEFPTDADIARIAAECPP